MDSDRFPREIRLRGSFTVEASFLMVIFLLVWILILRFTFYQTDLVRVKAWMAESCIRISEDSSATGSRPPEADGFFLLNPSGLKTMVRTGKVTISCNMPSILRNEQEPFLLETERKIRHPVPWMRVIHRKAK